jgi:hypothetical protein
MRIVRVSEVRKRATQEVEGLYEQRLEVISLVVPIGSSREHSLAHLQDLCFLLLFVLEKADDVRNDGLVGVRERCPLERSASSD